MATRLALVNGANGGIGSAICDRLRGNGFEVRTMDAVDPCDVMADLAVDLLPESAVADVDVCVCAAGVIDTFAPAHLMSAEQWSRDIDVNLTGAFRVVQAGLQGMIRTVAIENCALGITANCVLPGFVATPKVLAMPESNRNRILSAIPSGRFGRPDEVADLVTFLAGDDAGYITAQEIGIDGGLELNTLSIVGPNR